MLKHYQSYIKETEAEKNYKINEKDEIETKQ